MHTKFPQTFSSITISSDDEFDEKWNDANCNGSDKNKLKQIFHLISYPVTICVEQDYVDKVYRDSLYFLL